MASSVDDLTHTTLPSIYDTFVCREPAGDVPLLINNGPDEYTAMLRTLQRSADHYAERDYNRTVERIQFEMVRLHMQNQQWQRAMRTLVPLWQTLTWRRAGWWHLLEEVDWAMKECAIRVGDSDMIVAVEWELMSRSLTTRQESSTDFGQALEGLNQPKSRPQLSLRGEDILSCLSASFAFSKPQGNVSEPIQSQLVLTSTAHHNTSPIRISQIRVTFDGGLKDIVVHHEGEEQETSEKANDRNISIQQLQYRSLSTSTVLSSSPERTSSSSLIASADLQIQPGDVSVLSFSTMPRDAGEVRVTNITLKVKERDFDMDLLLSDEASLHQDHFWIYRRPKILQAVLKSSQSFAVTIHPKPPKLQIGLLGILSTYFVHETTVLDINISNQEEEAVEGILDVRVSGSPDAQPQLSWETAGSETDPLGGASEKSFVQKGDITLPPSPLGIIAAGAEALRQIRVHGVTEPVEFSLEIEARYRLRSDPETTVIKIHRTELVFIQPFEVSSVFQPVLHSDQWPNFFDVVDIDQDQRSGSEEQEAEGPRATGLIQRWSLVTTISSQTSDDLSIDQIIPIPHRLSDVVVKQIPSGDALPSSAHHDVPTLITIKQPVERTHILDIQKLSLEDRRPITLDFDLDVKFHRRLPRPASLSNPPRPRSAATSGIAPPDSRLTINTQIPIQSLSLPFSEPRILASLPPHSHITVSNSIYAVEIHFTLENPSPYSLPFTCLMETSPAFAFSGPKSCAVQLLPLTRRTFVFHIMILPPPSSSASSATDLLGDIAVIAEDAAGGLTAKKNEIRGSDDKTDDGSGTGGTWIYPVFKVIDTMFSKRLRVWPVAEVDPVAFDRLLPETSNKPEARGAEARNKGGRKALLRADTRPSASAASSSSSARATAAATSGAAAAGAGAGGIALWIPG